MNDERLWLVGVLAAGVLLPGPAEAQQDRRSFPDAPRTHWAIDAVDRLVQDGVLRGYPDGTLGGRRAMTRYELAIALRRVDQRIDRRIERLSIENLPRPGTRGRQGPPGPAGPPGPQGPPGVAPPELLQVREENLRLRNDTTDLQRLFQEIAADISRLRGDVEAMRDGAAYREELLPRRRRR